MDKYLFKIDRDLALHEQPSEWIYLAISENGVLLIVYPSRPGPAQKGKGPGIDISCLHVIGQDEGGGT